MTIPSRPVDMNSLITHELGSTVQSHLPSLVSDARMKADIIKKTRVNERQS